MKSVGSWPAKLLVASKCAGVASVSGLTADRERGGGRGSDRPIAELGRGLFGAAHAGEGEKGCGLGR